MSEIYYIKLVSGEDVIAKSEFQDDSVHYPLENPMLVQYFQAGGPGYSAGMRPWIPGLGNDQVFNIDRTNVMVIQKIENPQLVSFYEQVVERNTKDMDTIVETEEQIPVSTNGVYSTMLH